MTVPRSRGFTLLEMVIGMTLLGFIVTLLFSAFRLGSRTWNSTEAQIERVATNHAVRHFLQGVLTQTRPVRWKTAANQHIAFLGEPRTVRFISLMPSRLGNGGPKMIELFVDQEDGRDALLLRQTDSAADDKDFSALDAEEGRPLLTDTKKIFFAYFGKEQDAPDATAQWLTRWDNPKRLPQLIRVHVESEQNSDWPDLVVPFLLDESAGCLWDTFHQRCVW